MHLTSSPYHPQNSTPPDCMRVYCPADRLVWPNVNLLTCTRITARITRTQANLPAQKSSDMASHSNKTPQVSFEPHSYITVLTFSYDVFITNLILCKTNQKKCLDVLITTHIAIFKNQLSSKINHSIINITNKGTTLRYEIGSKTLKTQPHSTTQKMQPTLTPGSNTILQSQEQDHDMAESNLPLGTKRSQLIIHPNNQPKKTRCDLHSDHTKYANQNLWLGFQAMELLAKDTKTPPAEINISIRELIRMGLRKSEAAELYTLKISFPRVHQQRWPTSKQDGRTGHHYHLT